MLSAKRGCAQLLPRFSTETVMGMKESIDYELYAPG
jgi:hypothetical protein